MAESGGAAGSLLAASLGLVPSVVMVPTGTPVGVAGPTGGAARRQRQGDQAGHAEARRAGHPGGHVIALPPSRCRWVWKTVCPAPAPVLNTSR